MSVLVGLNNIKNCYIGTRPVKAIYVGTTKVWPVTVIPSMLSFTFTDGSLSMFDDFYDTSVTIYDNNTGNSITLDAYNSYGSMDSSSTSLSISFTITKSGRFNATHQFNFVANGLDLGYVVANRNTSSVSKTITVTQEQLKEIAENGGELMFEIVPTSDEY